MIKCLLLAAVALSLSGCFAGVETRSGWHLLSLPPSSGKRLAARCSSQPYVRSVDDKLRDLEMQNAALRAANEHLLKLDGRK